ncbi:MFS transporter [Hamadaea sp. NPDC050747]|uniref:MFS transporter n=1 Tax=Hamadaea sp. NPDC050747 TaxID=3155789 RepID=UPI0033E3F8AA
MITTVIAQVTSTPDGALEAAGWWARRFGGLPGVFWRLMIGVGAARLGFVVVPFLAFWLAFSQHYTPMQVGWVMTAFGTGWMIAMPLGGWLADRIGRRATITTTAIGAAGGYLILGGVHGLTATIAAAVLVGIGFDAYRPAIQSAVADTTTGTSRSQAMAVLYLTMNLSRLVACTLGGLLASGPGFRWLFIANAAANLLLAAVAWRVLPERASQPTHVPHSGSPVAASRMFFGFTAITLVFYTVHMQSMVALPVVLGHTGATPTVYGLLLALDPLVVAVVQVTAQQWLTRTPGLLVSGLGVAIVGTGLALTGLSPSVGWAAATIPIWVAGEVAFLTAAPAVIAGLAPAHQRGRYFGIWGATQGTAAVAAPLLATMAAGSDLLWIGGGLAGLAAAAACLALHHRHRTSHAAFAEGPAA